MLRHGGTDRLALKRNIVERDRGYRKILLSLEELDRTVVDVGIQSDAGAGEDGTPIAAYAAWNELGTADGHVPERPFMRSTFDETVGQLNALAGRLIGGVMDGKIAPRQAASLLGEQHETDIKRKIGSGVPPPNHPMTIKAKGSSKTLIDDGTMRQSVRYEIATTGRRSLRGILRNIGRAWRRG